VKGQPSGTREDFVELLRAEIIGIGREYATRVLASCECPKIGGLLQEPGNTVRMDLLEALRLAWDTNAAIIAYEEDELLDAADAALLVAIATWDGIASRPRKPSSA
jgi:hypothetical protein